MAEAPQNINYNLLGLAIEETYCTSSLKHDHTRSVKFSVHGGLLQAKYITVVNFINDAEIIPLRKKYEGEGQECVNAAIEKLKSAYREHADKSIKLKKISYDSSYEFINVNSYGYKRTAYYRYIATYEIE